jgi:ribosomal protein L11 methyltransferase
VKKWVELSVTVDVAMAEAVAAIMGKYGQGGAITEVWPTDNQRAVFVVKIFFPAAGLAEIRNSIHEEFKNLRYPYAISLRESFLETGDWLKTWRKHFKTFSVGQTLLVRPIWESGQPCPVDKKVILINPGMAFGTGLHPTTRLCLVRLEKYIQPGMSVLDLGTGSAILAIAAAKLGAASVLAMDIDPVATEEAKENVMANIVATSVEVRKGTLNTRTCRNLRDSFDLVVANITAKVIAGLAEHFAFVLKPSGRLIVGGISTRGLDEVLIRLSMAGLDIEAIDREGEWHSITATKS